MNQRIVKKLTADLNRTKKRLADDRRDLKSVGADLETLSEAVTEVQQLIGTVKSAEVRRRLREVLGELKDERQATREDMFDLRGQVEYYPAEIADLKEMLSAAKSSATK